MTLNLYTCCLFLTICLAISQAHSTSHFSTETISQKYPASNMDLQYKKNQSPYQLQRSQYSEIDKNAFVYSIIPRLLQQSSSNSTWDVSPKSNIYMILLIVGLIIIVGGSMLICIVLTIRHIKNRNNIHPNSKVANEINFNVDIVCPPIQFSLFVEEIGKPLHENCVICLDDFGESVSSVEIGLGRDGIEVSETNNREQEQKNKGKKKSNQKSKVCLTVCGHLLHSKCLREWVQREQICPLCREQFSNENLELWEKKLNLDFCFLYELFETYCKTQTHNFRQRVKMQCEVQHAIRNSIQLNWLALYKSRQITNKERHKKYGLQNIFKHLQKTKKQKQLQSSNIQSPIKQSPIKQSPFPFPFHNQSAMNVSGSKLKNYGLKKIGNDNLNSPKEKQKIVKDSSQNQNIQNRNWALYALVVYSAIMDYHDARVVGVQTGKRQEEVMMKEKVETYKYNTDCVNAEVIDSRSPVADIPNINSQ